MGKKNPPLKTRKISSLIHNPHVSGSQDQNSPPSVVLVEGASIHHLPSLQDEVSMAKSQWVNLDPRNLANSVMVPFQPRPISVVVPSLISDQFSQQPMENPLQPHLSSVLVSAKRNAFNSCKVQPQRHNAQISNQPLSSIFVAPHLNELRTSLQSHNSRPPAANINNPVSVRQSPSKPSQEDQQQPLNNPPQVANLNAPASVRLNSSETSQEDQQHLHQSKPSSWADKIINSSVKSPISLTFFPPKIDEGGVSVDIVDGDFVDEISECEKFVVGFFLGRRLPLHLVRKEIDKWPLKGSFVIQTRSDSCFYFSFNNPEDRAMVVEKGMTHVASRLFIMKEWSISIEIEAETLSTVPIWVILKGLPKFLQNANGSSKVASAIGIPLFPDSPTAEGSNESTARLCVEIDTAWKGSTEFTFPTIYLRSLDRSLFEETTISERFLLERRSSMDIQRRQRSISNLSTQDCFESSSTKIKWIPLNEFPQEEGNASHVLRVHDDEQAAQSIMLEEACSTGVTIVTKYADQRDHLEDLIEYKL